MFMQTIAMSFCNHPSENCSLVTFPGPPFVDQCIGSFLSFGKKEGTGRDELKAPYSIAVDQDGFVFVCYKETIVVYKCFRYVTSLTKTVNYLSA